jgi:type 1 glutamine amidotransferase
MLRRSGAAALALGLSRFPLGWAAAADSPKRHILMYTRSEGFQHDCVRRKVGQLSLAENIVTELGKKHNFEVTCEKDGRVFLSDTLKDYDGFLFETQGNLSKEKSQDGQPPMPAEGKQRLLKAIADGKGFVGCHCASDTFHSPGHYKHTWENDPRDKVDPYIQMVGGEFARHGEQQESTMHVVDADFPGVKGMQDFKLKEEWYSLKNFAPDLHVILVQETAGMRNLDYQRPNFPATWAHKYHEGRVFFTSMGHRDDVWKNEEVFQKILLGGLAWALRNVDAEIPPNLEMVTPHASELPKQQPKKDAGKKE